jgi:hypothetical protein
MTSAAFSNQPGARIVPVGKNRVVGLAPIIATRESNMSKFKITLLALTSLVLIACQPAITHQPTLEAQQVVDAVASPAATPLPTGTPVASPTATPSSEPTAVPTFTQATAPTTEPPPTPGVDRGVAYEVRSIEEVSAGRPPQIVDITDVDAVLVFDSSIALACSVVYGKTTAYGQISVDQDMDGGAHTDHHPLLLGLEPDTEYHYRVQGAAPDGTLYVGEDAIFRTLPAEEKTEVNLASQEAGGQVVDVSSNFGGAANNEPWGADSALDGSRGTAWSSNGDGNDAFVQIEMAQPAHVYAVEVWTRSMSDGTAQVLAFTLTTDSGDVLGPFTLEDAEQAYRFDVDVLARSLRLDVVDSTGGNTGLIEFAVYGTPVEN